jgi:cation transport regulator ChaC
MTSTNRLAIFAYGSLLFRPGFEYLARARAALPGYVRRFSQASPDHRGTPERPGRVVTLARATDAGVTASGAVYYVESPAEALLQALDYRERAGYQRVAVTVVTAAGEEPAVTWIAPPGNAWDVGELPLAELAILIGGAEGPSGRNADYVFQLEMALRELEAEDPWVSALARQLRAAHGVG